MTRIAEVTELAAEWSAQVDRIAEEIFAFIAARVPEATVDDEMAALTLASCIDNTTAVVAMFRDGLPASALDVPEAALAHARAMAERGLPASGALRFYRLGHAFLWDRWAAALVQSIADQEQLIEAMRETSTRGLEYVDAVSLRVNDEHIAARDRVRRRAALVREDIVRRLLGGEVLDLQQAEFGLGHRLTTTQHAWVCWTEGPIDALERAALAIARAGGADRPLVVGAGPKAVAGWSSTPIADVANARAAAAVSAPGVHVAIGRPGDFRAARETADRARRVAELTRLTAPSWTAYDDVALVDLLTADMAGARAFVAAELGALADDPRLCETVRLVVAPGGGTAAAARALGVHRNTVLARLRRATELRGQPLDLRISELHAALCIVQIAHR